MTINMITHTNSKINIYQVVDMIESDDKIILYSDRKNEMLIGIDDLPGTPIGTHTMTIYKCAIINIKVKF